MRLLLVVAAYYPESYGGAERQAAILAEALGRQGVKVTLVAPTVSADTPLVEQTSFGTVQRIRVRAYPNLAGRHILSFLRWTVEFFRRFSGPDFKNVPVYVFHARLHALGPALVAAFHRAPLLIKLGGGGESSDFIALRQKKYLYGKLAQALLLKRTDAFVANGHQIVNDLRALNVSTTRIAQFPNGVLLPPLADCKAAIDRRSGDAFVYTGRLHPDKRVDVLFDAALQMRGGESRFNLTFVGDGPEFERFAERIASDSDHNPVSLGGYQTDVYPTLLSSDFFVSASLREGQSNSLLEAMSAGVIPIVSGASGVSDVVSDGKTGFIVSDPDANGFANAFRRAMDLSVDQRKTMAIAARDFAERSIGIDSVAATTIDLLAKTTAARNISFHKLAAVSDEEPLEASLK